MMLPSIHGPCEKLAALDISIRDSWRDEELVRFLAERKAEDPLPLDVLAGVDCSVLDPWCFTGSVWHLKWSDDQKPYDSTDNGIRKAKNGYWKPVDSSRIPTNTAIMGVKIILEFYEGNAPCGKRTGWIMHEYQVEQNDEANLPQDYKSLCKVFLQSDKNAESGQSSLNANALNDSLESYLQYLAKIEELKHTISANEQDTASSTGHHEQKTQSAADDIDVHDVLAMGDYIEMNDLLIAYNGQYDISVHDNIGTDDYIELNDLLNSEASVSTLENTSKRSMIGTDDYIELNDLLNSEASVSTLENTSKRSVIGTDDYIELNDLLNSEASVSTSENTSKRSMISEEYFDPDEFLKEIYADSNTPDGQHKDHKFSIATPIKSASVVISPTEQGLLHIHGDNATLAGPSQRKRVPGGDRDQHSSKECQQHSSSISSCFPSRHMKRSHFDSSNSSQSSMKSQGVRPTSKFGKIGKKYFCFGSF